MATPDGDERERLEAAIDADLDEQVAAAPEEAEQQEQHPVETRGGHVPGTRLSG